MDLRLKKSLYAAEQDTVKGRVRSRPWREEIERIDPEKLILLDEITTMKLQT